MPRTATRVVKNLTLVGNSDTVALPPLTTEDDPFDGEELIPETWGDYTQVRPIATGGMGIVYYAWNTRHERAEAIKVLRSRDSSGSVARRRFELEAELAGTLNHPHIVQVYSSGEIDGRPYFSMRWLEGGDLSDAQQFLTRHPILLAQLMAKVAHAIHHAHRHGILHRDLKPSNVLLDQDGEPQISDFGLAKRLAEDMGVTTAGTVLGTPQYMAPEQARGERVLSTATDIYGLGGILYFLLTQRTPFAGKSVSELIRRILSEPPTPPRSLDPNIDPDLESICLKCLEKDPRDRYQSAAELAEDLERYARGQGVTARTPTLCEWLCREIHKEPPYFAGYAWQAKIWFGLQIAAGQALTTLAIASDWPAYVILLAFSATWIGVAATVWYYKAARFTRLPVVEQHAVMISFGLIAAHAALTLAYLPGRTTAVQMLDVYPGTFAVTAVALAALGATHWGRFYHMSIVALAAVPLSLIFPEWSPVAFGVGFSAAMFYWAVKIRTTFGREPATR